MARMDQVAFDLGSPECLLQIIQSQAHTHRCRSLPPYNHPGEDTDEEGKLGEGSTGRNVGEVGHHFCRRSSSFFMVSIDIVNLYAILYPNERVLLCLHLFGVIILQFIQ
jgi:hypothetical protein